MKQIKWDFSSKGWALPPGWTKGVGQRPKFNFFKYGHVAYQIKGNDVCSSMVVNILPI